VQASARLSTPAKTVSAACARDGGRQNLHDCNELRRKNAGGKAKRDAGSSAAAQQVGDYWERWQAAARAQRSVQRPEREPEQPGSGNGQEDIEFPAETKLAFTHARR